MPLLIGGCQRFTPKLFPSLVSSVFPSLLHLRHSVFLAFIALTSSCRYSYKYHYDLSNGPQILYMVRTKRVQILKYKYDLSNGPRIWCNQLWLLSMVPRLRRSKSIFNFSLSINLQRVQILEYIYGVVTKRAQHLLSNL